jgi:enamine deaminase RidA (YjgF/YER057c/UK114 family)
MTEIARHEPEGGILSNVVAAGHLVITAGAVGDDLTLDITGQTRETLAYVDKLLAQVGSDKSKILFATIWLPDIRLRDAMNEVWLAWVDPDNLPARACVEARMANIDYKVEMQIIAAR